MACLPLFTTNLPPPSMLFPLPCLCFCPVSPCIGHVCVFSVCVDLAVKSVDTMLSGSLRMACNPHSLLTTRDKKMEADPSRKEPPLWTALISWAFVTRTENVGPCLFVTAFVGGHHYPQLPPQSLHRACSDSWLFAWRKQKICPGERFVLVTPRISRMHIAPPCRDHHRGHHTHTHTTPEWMSKTQTHDHGHPTKGNNVDPTMTPSP